MVNGKQISALVSTCLLAFSTGMYYVAGNIIPYLSSYMRANVDSSIVNSDFTWLNGLSNLGYGIVIPASGLAKQYLGYRVSMLLAGFISSGFTALNYVIVSHSLPTFILTFGFLPWIGNGIIYCLIIDIIIQWFPTRNGLFSGITLSCISIGGFVFTALSTAVINPGNIEADLLVNHERFFTDGGLLSRVPNYFWQMSLITFGLVLLSLPGLFNPPTNATISTTEITTSETSDISKSQSQNDEITLSEKSSLSEIELPELNYRQMFRQKEFHIIWISAALLMMPANFFLSILKTYPLTFINDDKTLTTIASLSVLLTCIGKISWCLLYEKYSFRCVNLIYTGLFAICIQALAAAQYIESHPIVYYTAVMFLTVFCIGGTFAILPSITAIAFGPKHFATNFGIIYSSQALGSLLSAYINEIIVEYLRWRWSFTVAAMFPLVGFILTFFMPKDLKDVRKRLRNSFKDMCDQPPTFRRTSTVAE